MRRGLAMMAVVLAVGIGWVPSAFACGGFVAPNGGGETCEHHHPGGLPRRTRALRHLL